MTGKPPEKAAAGKIASPTVMTRLPQKHDSLRNMVSMSETAGA
jgi:hypothetical protein